MGMNIWCKEDVKRILMAVESAGEQNGPEYRRALADVGLGFGIELPPAQPWYAVMPASCRRLVTLHGDDEEATRCTEPWG